MLLRTGLGAFAIVGLAAFSALAGCGNASGHVSGGDPLFDASSGEGTAGPQDAASCGDPDADAGNGHAWSDLYRDYFGTAGKASCAGDGTCHGDATQDGAKASAFVCGHDVDTCYAGITSPKAGIITVGDTTSNPKNSGLHATLRKKCGGGSMPRRPASVSFDAADMARIDAWLQGGAPKG